MLRFCPSMSDNVGLSNTGQAHWWIGFYCDSSYLRKISFWAVSCPFFLLCHASCLLLFLDSLWCLDCDSSKNFNWLFLWWVTFLHMNFCSHTVISFIFTRRFLQILRLLSLSIPVQRIENSGSLLSLCSSKGNCTELGPCNCAEHISLNEALTPWNL